jgi:hypothetical protein
MDLEYPSGLNRTEQSRFMGLLIRSGSGWRLTMSLYEVTCSPRSFAGIISTDLDDLTSPDLEGFDPTGSEEYDDYYDDNYDYDEWDE